MDDMLSFDRIWGRVTAFQVEESAPHDGEEEYWCDYALEFQKWIKEYLMPVDSNLISINQDKLTLLDKYLEWRKFVPKTHQDYTGSRGHICIYHVFIRACEHLQVAELRLQKPLLFLPKDPPPTPPPAKYHGPMLFMGEVED
jgi:hypothetical protein